MKFNVLRGTFYVISNITLGILELVVKAIYLLIPVGAYMALLQFRDKISKATAISAFTNDDSTFQLIHPNFILVCVNPKKFRSDQKKILKSTDTFYDKYKSVIILGSILTLLFITYVGLFLK